MGKNTRFLLVAMIIGFVVNFFYDKYPNAVEAIIFWGVIIFVGMAIYGAVTSKRRA